ncbi:hypothetical protein V5F77_08510 [Xanthobacter sp. DSM 24535]|uniref:hypothetical protein n=1 Tax=Roseixanthobacter psychrophilus TaxID=3119917 RepID=UPI003728FDB8
MALDMEHRIDRQEHTVTRKSRDAQLFRDLVALHRQDMEEVGIRIGRSKDFCLISLTRTGRGVARPVRLHRGFLQAEAVMRVAR